MSTHPLTDLPGDPANPRTITEAAAGGLGYSLQEFGDLSGIVFNDRTGELVAGHQRVQRLRAAGATTFERDGMEGWITHPATGERFGIRFVDWEREKQRAANIVANSPALQGSFTPLVLEQLDSLEAYAGADTLLLHELHDTLAVELAPAAPSGKGNTDPDDVPDPPAEPRTRRGDLYLLGNHRLLCGDSTSPEDVARVMDGDKAALMNTDPPYGIDYVRLRDATGRWETIENDDLTDGAKLQAFLEAMIRAAVPHLNDNAAFYLWHPMLTQGTFFAAAAAAAILIHRQIIWVKPSMILTPSGWYHWKHELCFFGWRRGHKPPWFGPMNQTSVWELGRDGGKPVHPTQKPVALFEIPMQNHVPVGGVCFEPFSGSGSQIIAGERLGRSVRAIELSPGYVDAAVARWEAFTGRKAELVRR